jgi:hypothetical protein
MRAYRGRHTVSHRNEAPEREGDPPLTHQIPTRSPRIQAELDELKRIRPKNLMVRFDTLLDLA